GDPTVVTPRARPVPQGSFMIGRAFFGWTRAITKKGSAMAETAGGGRVIEAIEAPAPGDWKIAPAHSEAAFVARYLMVTKVRGVFRDFSGISHIAEMPEGAWDSVR